MPASTKIDPRGGNISIDSANATLQECIDQALFFRIAAYRTEDEQLRDCHTEAATLWEQAARLKKLH